jgi:hypothetical protein
MDLDARPAIADLPLVRLTQRLAWRTQMVQRIGRSTPRVSFEEYKLYYESAEKVTERRLSMNRWNYSVMVATLLAIGGVVSWTTSHKSFLLTGILGILILSATASLMCVLWIKQIDDFKALNTAKFKIINEMAPLVEFEGPSGPATRSFRCFEKEWDEMGRLQALQRAKKRRMSPVQGLSSTSAEYFIPRALMGIFLLVFVGVCLFAATNWKDMTAHLSPFNSTQKVGTQ